LCLGHIDADKDMRSFQNTFLLDFTALQRNSTLQKMRAFSPANCSSFWGARMGRPCYKTVSNELGAVDLSHPVSC
jgi:hypothetical protein